MRFWLKWIIFLFLFLATAEKEYLPVTQTETKEETTFDTELQPTRQHIASSQESAGAQGAITSHSSRTKFVMEQPGSFLNGAYTALRPAPVNYLPHLLTGKTLQETIDRFHQHIHRNYLASYHNSIGLKPLPVCNYYVFALRHIII